MRNFRPNFLFILKCKLLGRSFVYDFYFKGKKTVDIGCGEGEFLRNSKDLIWGFDANKRAIERLKSEGFNVQAADITMMPYSDSQFDMAHCHNVIEHLDISSALKMLAEARRILKVGGCLVLSSEVVTKKFWDTFGHVKPYPPESVIKLCRHDSREEFEGLAGMDVVGLFYIGDYFKNRLVYLISFFVGYFTPFLRREYFLVLRKK